MAGSATALVPAIGEVAALLAALRLLRHPAAAAETLLQGQLEGEMPVPLPKFVHDIGRGVAIGGVNLPQSLSAGFEQIVHVERDRSSSCWPILDESGAERTAVKVRIELVGAEQGEALIVVDRETIRECAGVAANVEVPLPVGPEIAPFAHPVIDRVLNPGLLVGAGELGAKPRP